MPSEKIMEQKKQQVDELAKIFDNPGVYLFDYRGLNVQKMSELRNKVKELDGNVRVIRNRVAVKLFEREKLEQGRELFQGPMAVAYADEKFVDVAKALVEFEKENEELQIKAGFIEKNYADKAKVKYLAKLPGKEQLLAQLVGAISMPLKKMGMALSAPLTTTMILMNNLKDKKEKEEKNNG